MFTSGITKAAVVLGALTGAALGGEKDKHGKIKHRGIGALRGAATELGLDAGARLGGRAVERVESALERRHIPPTGRNKALAAMAFGIPAVGGPLLGSLGGYHAAKKFGPEYEHEKKAGLGSLLAAPARYVGKKLLGTSLGTKANILLTGIGASQTASDMSKKLQAAREGLA